MTSGGARVPLRQAAGVRRCRTGGALPALALLLCAALAVGCGPQFGSMAEARAGYARRAQGPVVVAAVEDPLGPEFVLGIELAAREIGAADGGLLGRALVVRRFRGGDALGQVRRTARDIARDPRVSAVLGHRGSAIAVPASVMYERAQVLFLPSFATAEQLTRHGFDFVLRTVPDDVALAAQTASVAELLGHRRIAVLHSGDDHARELAFRFEDAARARGLTIVFRASVFGDETNHRGVLGQLNAVPFDALYLSAGQTAGARIVAQLRELGFGQPVLGSDRLAGEGFSAQAGPGGERTLAPSVYDAGDSTPRNRAFAAAYRIAYGTEPNQEAAQGYDMAMLFAHIVRFAGSTEPRALATAAHYAPPFVGVTGIFAYDPRGNLFGKVYEFRVLRFARWWSLPGVTAPYRLASFRVARQALAQERQARGAAPPPAAGTLGATPGATAGAATAPTLAPTLAPPLLPILAPILGAKAGPAGTPGAGADLALAVPAHLNRVTLTAARLTAPERERIRLSLAHEILGFRRLGVVVTQTGAATVDLARTLAEERGFRVEVCELPKPGAAPNTGRDAAPNIAPEPAPPGASDPARSGPDGLTQDPLEQAALRCWSRLARVADALLVVPDAGLRPELVRRLNRTLRRFAVPSFAVAETLNDDLGLTLALAASGIDLEAPQVAMRFDGVLSGLTVPALNRQLANLPAVSADFEALAELGVRPDLRLLGLISRAIEPASATPPPGVPAPARDAAPAPAARTTTTGSAAGQLAGPTASD